MQGKNSGDHFSNPNYERRRTLGANKSTEEDERSPDQEQQIGEKEGQMNELIPPMPTASNRLLDEKEVRIIDKVTMPRGGVGISGVMNPRILNDRVAWQGQESGSGSSHFYGDPHKFQLYNQHDWGAPQYPYSQNISSYDGHSVLSNLNPSDYIHTGIAVVEAEQKRREIYDRRGEVMVQQLIQSLCGSIRTYEAEVKKISFPSTTISVKIDLREFEKKPPDGKVASDTLKELVPYVYQNLQMSSKYGPILKSISNKYKEVGDLPEELRMKAPDASVDQAGSVLTKDKTKEPVYGTCYKEVEGFYKELNKISALGLKSIKKYNRDLKEIHSEILILSASLTSSKNEEEKKEIRKQIGEKENKKKVIESTLELVKQMKERNESWEKRINPRGGMHDFALQVSFLADSYNKMNILSRIMFVLSVGISKAVSLLSMFSTVKQFLHAEKKGDKDEVEMHGKILFGKIDDMIGRGEKGGPMIQKGEYSVNASFAFQRLAASISEAQAQVAEIPKDLIDDIVGMAIENELMSGLSHLTSPLAPGKGRVSEIKKKNEYIHRRGMEDIRLTSNTQESIAKAVETVYKNVEVGNVSQGINATKDAIADIRKKDGELINASNEELEAGYNICIEALSAASDGLKNSGDSALLYMKDSDFPIQQIDTVVSNTAKAYETLICEVNNLRRREAIATAKASSNKGYQMGLVLSKIIVQSTNEKTPPQITFKLKDNIVPYTGDFSCSGPLSTIALMLKETEEGINFGEKEVDIITNYATCKMMQKEAEKLKEEKGTEERKAKRIYRSNNKLTVTIDNIELPIKEQEKINKKYEEEAKKVANKYHLPGNTDEEKYRIAFRMVFNDDDKNKRISEVLEILKEKEKKLMDEIANLKKQAVDIKKERLKNRVNDTESATEVLHRAMQKQEKKIEKEKQYELDRVSLGQSRTLTYNKNTKQEVSSQGALDKGRRTSI